MGKTQIQVGMYNKSSKGSIGNKHGFRQEGRPKITYETLETPGFRQDAIPTHEKDANARRPNNEKQQATHNTQHDE